MVFESRNSEVGAVELVAALATELLVTLLRRPSGGVVWDGGPEGRVRRYGRDLSRSFWSSESMDDVARRLALSRRTFSTLFRRIHGRFWLKEVHNHRIRHAEALLRTTNLPVKAVAFECGYRDLSHFYRRFVAQHGLTPSQCRRRQSKAG